MSPECHLREVEIEGWVANGGIGVALYSGGSLYGVVGLTLEIQAGVLRYDGAQTDGTSVEALDGNIPTFMIDLGTVMWMM